MYKQCACRLICARARVAASRARARRRRGARAREMDDDESVRDVVRALTKNRGARATTTRASANAARTVESFARSFARGAASTRDDDDDDDDATPGRRLATDATDARALDDEEAALDAELDATTRAMDARDGGASATTRAMDARDGDARDGDDGDAGAAMRARDAPKMWRARYVDEVEAPRRGRERSRATPTLADAFGTRRGDVELAMASIPAVSARDAVRGKSLSERLSRVVSRVDEIQSSVDEAKRLLGMD